MTYPTINGWVSVSVSALAHLIRVVNAPDRFGQTFAISGVGPCAMLDVQLLDRPGRTDHRARGIFAEPLLLVRLHQAKQIAWLRVVVVIDAMIPVIGRTFDRKWWFSVIGL